MGGGETGDLMSQYVALLRGINVGGNNLIKMTALKACFESDGFRDVSTYIASGNVLFSSDDAERAQLTRRIEQLLSATFKYQATVVVRTRKQMQAIVERAPAGFGAQPARYRYDVIFLMEPLTAKVVIKSVLTREGVDQAYAGSGVLYFSRLVSRVTQSKLGKIVYLPTYQSMTIRNWNTTTKLLQVMEKLETRAQS
jgi:uncharacterized protein (DUF1697 family)